MWTSILNKLEELMKEITTIQGTYIYEVEKFNGSPVCTITPSENSSDYETVNDNERMYAFHIRLFVNRSKIPTGNNDASEYSDRILRNLVDEVLDKLDSNYTLTGITVPTGYIFMNMFAAPSTWGYVDREDLYRVAEINVKCRVSVDIHAI